jgi:broad specificity phosphatase PhoE
MPADQELTPDAFMAGRKQVAAAQSQLTPDSFMQGQQAAPQRPSDALPHPDLVDQHTTAIARATVEAATIPIPGTERLGGAPLPAWKVALPEGLKTNAQRRADAPLSFDPKTGEAIQQTPLGAGEDPFTKLLDAPFTGGREAVHGFERMAEPEMREKAGGASQVLRGGMEAATPLLVGSAAVAPVATLAPVAVGMGVQSATEKLLRAAKVPEEYAALGSDLVAIFGAGGAFAKLRSLSKLSSVREGNAIAQRLQAALDRAKDTGLPESARAAARAQADALLEGLRSAESGGPGAGVNPAVGAGGVRELTPDTFMKEKSDVTQKGSQRGATEARSPERRVAAAGAQSGDKGGAAGASTANLAEPEFFRGDWNVPLNEKGLQQVRDAGAKNAGKFDAIYAGTKQRHRDTAGAYAEKNPQAGPVRHSPAFDPMHMGAFEGELVTPERAEQVNDHIRNRPNEPIPGVGKFSGSPGEKPAEWSRRLIGGVQGVIGDWKPGEKRLVVTSGRDVQAVRAWVAKGMPADGSVDPDVLTQQWKTGPGEMMRLDPRTGKVEDVERADGDGIYFARHGETDANKNPAIPAEIAGTIGKEQSRGSASTTERPVDGGATGEGRAVPRAAAPGARSAPGEDTEVLIPGDDRAIRARYEVRELADVQPSHNGQTFSPNERYELKNERDYAKAENQQRVVENSSEERFNPRYHITDNPDATNGPVLIDEHGNAIGGNSRAMILQRVYARNGKGASAYRELLEKKAQQFGIDPAAVRGMKEPVLVRVAPNEELGSLPGGSKWAVRKTNVSGTAQLSASERAAADAGQLAPELVEHIAGAIEDAGPDATLNDALTGKTGTAIVNRLIAEGFFSEQERPALMDGKTGALTQLAKDRISKALLGQFFRDSDQISRTPASIRNKLERIAAPLAKVQGNPEWDLTPAIREAIDLLEYAGAHGIKNLNDVVAQQSMLGEEPAWKSDAIRLAEWLRDEKPNDLVAAARRYVNDREETMFGQATPTEAFQQHFGGVKAERPAAAGAPTPAAESPAVAAEPALHQEQFLPGPQPEVEPPPISDKQESAIKQFLGEETGTSLVGAILKADLEEALALKAKRDAALVEAEKAQATPGEQKFGQKTIEWFTGERDIWGARVNQVIDRLRTLVPDPAEQEALSLMRDFKNKPQELVQFLDGTHPALQELDASAPLTRGLPGSEFATAMERIRQMKPAIVKALNPTKRMLEADAVLTKIAAGTLAEGQKLGFLDSRWTADEYNPHILHPKGEGELPTRPAGDRLGRAMGGKMSRYFAFAERREFPTLMHAVIANYKPKTLNAFDAFTIHGDNFATARATHLLTQQLGKSGLGAWGVRERAPDGWEPLAPHSPEFRNLVGYEDEQGLPAAAEQRLFVPRYIADALKPITDPDYMGRIPLFRAMRMTQAYQKTVQLGLSFFHAYTENLMSLANSGVKGWAKALRADRESPEFLAAERDMIAHGGTSAIQGRTFEAYKALQPGSIPTWSEIWRRAPVVHQLDTLAGKITEFTFGNLQRRFKVTDYQLHKAAWMAEHPNATQAELTAAKQSIAKEINAVYGGLNWENLGINRATVEVTRALMLAPDWTISNIFNLKYSLERGTPAGSMARKFWMRTIIGGLAATQAMSLMMSGKLSKNPTQVYYGQDSEGKEIYQNVFFKGASGDAVNLVHNVADYGAVQGLARSISGKAAPLVRAGIQIATNRDYLGRPIVPQGMHPIAGTVRAAVKTGEAVLPVPFTVSNLHDMLLGPDAGKYSVPEFLTTTFAGNPPRHMAPEGMRMTKQGLRPKHEKPRRSIWEEIETGKR